MSGKWKEAPEALRKALQVAPDINANIYLGRLTDAEMFWARLQPFLLVHGFKLRPRYQSGWVPSWKDCDMSKNRLSDFEDAMIPHQDHIMDAVRVWDGIRVMMKCVDMQNGREEFSLACYLSSPEQVRDKRNHSVPFLAILPVPNDTTKKVLVMPMLAGFHAVPFRRIGEFAEMVQQFLEVSA
ncbi:hypothetical protein H0H92_011089 [Tricholoma furcatifolium]|nr:hypothetical protein H0H92_011089 [Tricholoma furcatifolium]